MDEIFEFLDRTSYTGSLEYFGMHIIIIFFSRHLLPPSRVFLLGPSEAGRERKNLEISSGIQLFHLFEASIPTYGAAKLEGALRFSATGRRETFTRLPGSFARTYHYWKSDNTKTPHPRNITVSGILYFDPVKPLSGHFSRITQSESR